MKDILAKLTLLENQNFNPVSDPLRKANSGEYKDMKPYLPPETGAKKKTTKLEKKQVSELKAGDQYGDAAGGMQTDSMVMYEEDEDGEEIIVDKSLREEFDDANHSQDDPWAAGYGHYHRELYNKPHPKNPHELNTPEYHGWEQEYQAGHNERRRERSESVEPKGHRLSESTFSPQGGADEFSGSGISAGVTESEFKKATDLNAEIDKLRSKFHSLPPGSERNRIHQWIESKLKDRANLTWADKDNIDEEQVNELSPQTMKSYVKKALDPRSEKSISNKASKGGYDYAISGEADPSAGEKDDHKAYNRSKGVQRAVDKLTKESDMDEAAGAGPKDAPGYGKKVTDANAVKVKALAKQFFGDNIYSAGRIAGGTVYRMSFHMYGIFQYRYCKFSDLPRPVVHKLKAKREKFLAFCQQNGVGPDLVDLKFHIGSGIYASVRAKLTPTPAPTNEEDTMSPINEKSKSEKQARFMAMAAHNPKMAKKVGIPQKVAKEFNKADKGTKQLSHAMKHKPTNEDRYDDIHGIVTGAKGHKGRDLGDKITDVLLRYDYGNSPRNASEVIRFLKKIGLSDNEISQVRDIANQAGKSALDFVARKYKIPEEYLSNDLKGNFIVYSPFINAGDEVINKWRQLTNKLMMPKLRTQLGNGDYATESRKSNMKNLKESYSDAGLERVLRHFGKEVSQFTQGEDLDDRLYDALYDYWFDEMPYGTKKARDGDPYQWVSEKLSNELDLGMANIDQSQPKDIPFSHDERYDDMEEAAMGDAPVYAGGADASPLTTSPMEEGEYDSDEKLEALNDCDGYVQDLSNGSEVFRMTGDPYERRVRIDDKDGRGWYIAPHRLTPVYDEALIARWFPDNNSGEDDLDEGMGDECPECGGSGYNDDGDICFNCGGDGYEGGELDESDRSEYSANMAMQPKPTTPRNPEIAAKVAAARSAAEKNAGAPMQPTQIKKPGQIGVSEEEEVATSFNPRGEYDTSEPTDYMGNLDETFLIEGLEELITEILEEHGLDHGLDFFFDNGLVAIGKSTARVIINALKSDHRIQATPTFGRVDGEEVQISFDMEHKKNEPAKELSVDDIPAADFDVDSPNSLEVDEMMGEAKGQGYQPKTGEKCSCKPGTQRDNCPSCEGTGYKIDFAKIRDKKEVKEDALNDIRRLSGLPTVQESFDESSNECAWYVFDKHNNDTPAAGPFGTRGAAEEASHQFAGADIDYGMVDATGNFVADQEPGVAEAEGEYVNAPKPEVHTSTTDMINRGTDLNRPKRQDYTIRNLGNNPMAEARKLMRQYEFMKDQVKK